MSRRSFIIKTLLAIIAGILIRFSLLLYQGWITAALGLCILCLSLEGVRERIKRVVVSGAFLLALSMSQLSFLFSYCQAHSWWSLLLIPTMAICYGAVFEILILLPDRLSAEWIILSFLLTDFAFPHYPIGSPLMQLGVTVGDIPGIDSVYSLVGPYWITLWFAILALTILKLVRLEPIKAGPWAVLAIFPLLCLCVCVNKNSSYDTIRVAMIPLASIEDKDKVGQYLDSAVVVGAEIVALPEGIYTFIHPQETVSPAMTKLLRDVKAGRYPTILMGLWTLAPGRFENAAVSYSKNGVFRRDKAKRIPFGEYVPMQKLLRGRLDKLIPYRVTLREGGDGNVFPLGGIGYSPLICYEALFTNLMAEFVREGAELFFVLSSNSLIDSRQMERQINNILKMNAAITARSIVRCVENGISVFITPRGDISEKTEFRTGLYSRDMEICREKTFYVKYSRSIDFLYSFVLICLSVITLRSKT